MPRRTQAQIDKKKQAQIDKKQAQIDKKQAQIDKKKQAQIDKKQAQIDKKTQAQIDKKQAQIDKKKQAQIDKKQAQIDKKTQAQINKTLAQIDEKQAQIEVVKAMRSEGKRKELSADDRVFLATKDINPEIPAADQEVRIEKLLDKLEEDKVQGQAALRHHLQVC